MENEEAHLVQRLNQPTGLVHTADPGRAVASARPASRGSARGHWRGGDASLATV
jgi:hypothetical protein